MACPGIIYRGLITACGVSTGDLISMGQDQLVSSDPPAFACKGQTAESAPALSAGSDTVRRPD